MTDVPGPSKRFSTDNCSISVAKKHRKINQDSNLDESECSSEEAAYSQCNDEDQSDMSEDSGTFGVAAGLIALSFLNSQQGLAAVALIAASAGLQSAVAIAAHVFVRFRAARLDPCELRTVVPYTYTLSERSAELHGNPSPSLSLGSPSYLGGIQFPSGKSEALGSIAAKIFATRHV
ncbi:hypothetical protein EVAR_99530_1 [Eumeta japonica]|uniref:Uncharacterized protein n=1 Tax=Eumeta variegata TaxID=151549 RepID=A0A4C2A235_EUMVA|nr:hypothetical protein EVAR_99530_1 [Eumeta japonica]